ncbi:hypothetical protein [Ochrobactrum sp. Marseille-Q0166]|uniref:hypothetical protein n=1 Tax=Ochrobactrum sp. Marseille-Q0166 TaxID=2761105 RepID=UPI001655F14F|nr:hypothetical protein [Ochrobactrum sp. Marseille-Q0166]MBC8719949.1 hypothetical protein [Ochrobactrum sp. Marseille-Q0166]
MPDDGARVDPVSIGEIILYGGNAPSFVSLAKTDTRNLVLIWSRCSTSNYESPRPPNEGGLALLLPATI